MFTIFLNISIWKKVGIVGVKVDMKNNSSYTLVQLFIKILEVERQFYYLL